MSQYTPYPQAPHPNNGPISSDPQPIQVEVRLPQRQPWVVYTIIAVTVFMYLLQIAGESILGADIVTFLGAKINSAIDSGELWRLLTPALLHGSITHLAFNMYALFSLGRGLERFYGHGRFIVLYGISALAGNILSYLLTPHASVGASTAIFGLAAAEGVFILRNRFLFGSRSMSMLVNIGMILAVNLFIGLAPRIDNWGHLGGLFGGLFFAWFAGPRLQVTGFPPAFDLVELNDRGVVFTVAGIELLLLGLVVFYRLFFA